MKRPHFPFMYPRLDLMMPESTYEPGQTDVNTSNTAEVTVEEPNLGDGEQDEQEAELTGSVWDEELFKSTVDLDALKNLKLVRESDESESQPIESAFDRFFDQSKQPAVVTFGSIVRCLRLQSSLIAGMGLSGEVATTAGQPENTNDKALRSYLLTRNLVKPNPLKYGTQLVDGQEAETRLLTNPPPSSPQKNMLDSCLQTLRREKLVLF